MSNANDFRNRAEASVERLTLPTYPEAPAEELPMFAENRVHQRSSGNPYPNAVVIKTRGDGKADREYTAIRVENEYLLLYILPELGGRVFSATDKTTGYDFFYRQHVIKPALIGALGSWISGGVEFNWPYHHRPSTFLPVDFEIEREENGAVVVWLSEHEPIDRMKGMVGIRLEPGRAAFETVVRLYNRTPLRRSFLWWENTAVPVNEDYRIFFPPDVRNVYFHYRRSRTSYPTAKGMFNGFDFGDGVDISRHGNSEKATSYFSAASRYDFFGGYDERKGRGVVHFADHHTSTGKKMFTWAYGQLSVSWENALTDTDGPYAELMAGSYTDNQPDFSWLEPFETKRFTQSWYPLADLGVPTFANFDAAVRVDKRSLRVQPTVRMPHVLLTLTSGGETAELAASLEPGRVSAFELPFDAEPGYSLTLTSDEKTVLYYKNEVFTGDDEPFTLGDLPFPEDFKSPSAYRCYLAGVHVEQYRDPKYDPEPYFRRALALDPGFALAHTALGKCALRRGEYGEAVRELRQAIKLTSFLNKNPESGRAWYLLGLALERSDPGEVCEAFFKAMWSADCVSPAMTRAAALAGGSGDFMAMEKRALHALSHGTDNFTAAVYASLAELRLGDTVSAVRRLRGVLAVDPLFHLARYALTLCGEGTVERFADALRSSPWQTATDVCCDLACAGFEAEGKALLGYVNARFGGSALTAYLAGESGAGLPTRRTFPFREEERLALESAITRDDTDSDAKYLLGCLYYSRRRYDKAAALWEASSACASTENAWKPLRCLALCKWRAGDKSSAVDLLSSAQRLKPESEQLIFELAYLLNRSDAPYLDTARFIEGAERGGMASARDDVAIELAKAYNRGGDFAGALRTLDRRFIPCEGGEGAVSSQYMTACHGLARALYTSGDFTGALEGFRRAQVLPKRLGAGLWHEAPLVPHLYYEALCLERLGRRSEAEPLYRRILALTVDFFSNMHLPELPVWQARALVRLGRPDEGAERAKKQLVLWESELKREDPGHFATTPFFISYTDDPASERKAYYSRLIGLAEDFISGADRSTE